MNRYIYPTYKRTPIELPPIGAIYKNKPGVISPAGNMHSKIKISGHYINATYGDGVNFTDIHGQIVMSYLTSCTLATFNDLYETI